LNAARKKHITSLPTNPKRKNVHSAFTLNTHIIGGTKEKKNSIESARKFITQRSSWQSACLSMFMQAVGLRVQPVATSDVFCT